VCRERVGPLASHNKENGTGPCKGRFLERVGICEAASSERNPEARNDAIENSTKSTNRSTEGEQEDVTPCTGHDTTYTET
jgi:hypothetical protein